MQVERNWCNGFNSSTTSNTSFTWPTTFGRRHHCPPYNIFYEFLRGLHPNGIFSQDSQNWNFYCPKALDIHIFFKSTILEHVITLSYSPQKVLSNGVLHAPIKDHLTFALKGFVVGSQNFNLTPTLSFDHSSCISRLNEQCKGISSIYNSRTFQWYP